MVEFQGNPFEVVPSKTSLSGVASICKKIPFLGWVIILCVLGFIGYQIFDSIQAKKGKEKE